MARVCVRDIVRAIEEFAPRHMAESWDNVGLLIGDENQLVRGVLVALDVTTQIVDEARKARANVIVSHHPLIFRPISSLQASDPISRIALSLARAEIAHIAAHTNLDNTAGGLNDRLADMLGIQVYAPLRGSEGGERGGLYKVITFVPVAAWQAVRDAMAEAGAGKIGDYSHCSFRVRGTGTFLPLQGATPSIGTIDKLEEVEEFRLEMVAPAATLDDVIRAMRLAHPYEEVAFDVIALHNVIEKRDCNSAGAGRIGTLPKKTTLKSLTRHVQKILSPIHLRVVGNPQLPVQRVAICTGSGSSLIDSAVAAGADVLITGDVKHHNALRAQELGLAIVDPGHATSENHAVDLLTEIICGSWPSLTVLRSRAHSELFR